MTPFVFQIAPHINFKFFDKSNSYLRLEDIGKQTDDGAPPVPSNFTTITPLVMTPHCHAPSCIRHYLPLEVKGATGPLGFMTLSFTPFGRSSHVTHQYLAFFTDGKKPRQRYFALWEVDSFTIMSLTTTITLGARQEFWNADTGEIICNMTAAYGDEKYFL